MCFVHKSSDIKDNRCQHVFFLFFSSTLHSHNFQIFQNLEIIFLHQNQIYNNFWHHHFIIKGDVSIYVNHTFLLHHNLQSLVKKTIQTKPKKKKNPQNQITNKPTLGIQNDQQENQAVMNLRSLNHSVVPNLAKRIKL